MRILCLKEILRHTMLYELIKPLLFRLEPERAHELVTSILKVAIHTKIPASLVSAALAYDDPILHVECAGMHFSNPIGLAAGFDKHGELIRAMASLGFGHVEVGTVTPRAQSGNPMPRMFRLPEDGALINRMGFNSPGMLHVARNLKRWWADDSTRRPVLGINIGKNLDTALEQAAQDYLSTFVALAALADYVAINISSPNTPGLRLLHERSALEELLGTVCQVNNGLKKPCPVFVKISPDESEQQIAEVVEVGLSAGITGFIATNTTLAREGLCSTHVQERGGLSGRPLAQRSLLVLRQLQQLTDGRVPLISVGGVASAEDAYQRLQSGASLVQLYTALIYGGPTLVQEIKRGLAYRMRHSQS